MVSLSKNMNIGFASLASLASVAVTVCGLTLKKKKVKRSGVSPEWKRQNWKEYNQ